jgi:GNAT superfamily N-acetyltransferase
MRVRPRTDEDRAEVEPFLAENHSERVARRGELLTPVDHPELLAETESGALAGVLTYVIRGEECEILTLHTTEQWRGAGTALVEEVARIAAGAGCARLWLVTTNDNVDALRFYQRRGFVLRTLRPGAVDESRAMLKPEIPTTGFYGIALRDEIELERDLH